MKEQDCSLLRKYRGCLRVFIRAPSGAVFSTLKDLSQMMPDATLFDYVAQAAANIFTNLTTRLSIATAPDHWEVEEFLPEQGILRVKQIAGEPLALVEDDPTRLYGCHGIIIDLGPGGDSNN